MMSLALLAVASTQAAYQITIDTRYSKPISPYIYGANHPDWQKLGNSFTLARQGGNRMTAYNWETNASNAGNDWHHQNDGYLGESDEPGWTARTFMEEAQKHGAAVILTVPTLGYVAADKKGDGDVNKTPSYLEARFNRSLPKKPGGRYDYPPNTQDRVVYQDEFVTWIQKTKSSKTPVWFSLDNEPDLWHSTHARIMPKNVGYAGIIANNIEFASAIKSVAPRTLVFGPANYGWQGFRTFQGAEDANGRDFLNVYLAAMREAERTRGRRLVDVLDIHWYPEARGGGVRIAFNQGGENEATYEARIQASRSLWDPTYMETSWIADTLKEPIRLLPRVLSQVREYYPGTKLGITEYDFGGGDHESGLVAQADVLGLFGRYGLFAACQWGVEPQDPAQLAGFRAFTAFDGRKSRFGDLAVSVNGQTPSDNAIYAALDSRNRSRLTLVAINKTKTRKNYKLNLTGFRGRSVKAYRAVHNKPFRPEDNDASINGNTLSFSVGPRGVVTLEVLRR